MSASSDAFEQLNARIARLIQAPGTTVKWNAEIPDPDNGNSRQIDVLITSADGKRTSVECREHSAAQSVKWIEELIGRKLSLKLDGMIGVSLNGFSAPAQAKAALYGIVLYDFERLTDQEIASWGGLARVESVFVQFDQLEITAGIPVGTEGTMSTDQEDPIFLCGAADGFGLVQDALRDAVAALPGTVQRRVLDPSAYTVAGVPLTLLECTFSGRLVSVSASCLSVALVDAPGVSRALRSVQVQRYEHSVQEVLRQGTEAHLVIDFSALAQPDNAILHETRVLFSSPATISKYEVVGERRRVSRSDRVSLQIVTTAPVP